MQEMQHLLQKKGISMISLEKEALKNDASFNVGLKNPASFVSGRDEFGLPIFKETKIDSTTPAQVFDKFPKSNSPMVTDANSGNSQMGPKQATSWTQIVQNPSREAKLLWLHLGFVKLYMVKKGFFVYKFNTEIERNGILAGGLCYVANGVGNPLQLDSITEKMESMPYAKVLVEASADEPLPPAIDVTIYDAHGNVDSYQQAKVEYYNKPSQCPVCKVFGHSLARFQNSTTTWVPKVQQESNVKVDANVEHVPDIVVDTSVGVDAAPVPDVAMANSSDANMTMPTVDASASSPDKMPPIPTSGILSKLKQVDEVPKIRGILKYPTMAPTSSGTKNKLDSDGWFSTGH
ncbi:hypothetical protein POM88_026022 [Heracleum sosnowskyi]|uniref:Uncharacterized protein n=1 Tax=Heracleum sosnowskyi TaxID=360622 RepID=A0AAD8MPF9_9APIA|nr:hypothetical protein POM88_026022 [Heracleum sosnowskyi]